MLLLLRFRWLQCVISFIVLQLCVGLMLVIVLVLYGCDLLVSIQLVIVYWLLLVKLGLLLWWVIVVCSVLVCSENGLWIQMFFRLVWWIWLVVISVLELMQWMLVRLVFGCVCRWVLVLWCMLWLLLQLCGFFCEQVRFRWIMLFGVFIGVYIVCIVWVVLGLLFCRFLLLQVLVCSRYCGCFSIYFILVW